VFQPSQQVQSEIPETVKKPIDFSKYEDEGSQGNLNLDDAQIHDLDMEYEYDEGELLDILAKLF
jgi:hypothetical protein